jgi:tripartite-type tricarboxylate transporter receptor subunit TctC
MMKSASLHDFLRAPADRRLRRAVLIALAAAGFAATQPAGAAAMEYPSRPVRLVVPWPAGGGADTVGRVVAQDLTDAIGQQIVVDNRPGASAIVGTEVVAHAQPDGYTLLLATVTTGINPHLHRDLSYDPLKDFESIVLLASSPYLLTVNPSLPARSVKELIALAKAGPNRLNYASTGSGSAPNLTAEWFKAMTGTSIVHVPYKGGPPAMNDLIAGHVQMTFGNIVNYLAQARSGKLRALAVTSEKRTPQAQDIPTMVESGLPGFVTGTWFGLQAPAHTPKAIVSRLNATCNKLLQNPQLPKRLAGEGADPIGGTPEQFVGHIRTELERWGKVIRAANIRID